jgi:DNA modification methylase
MALLTEAKITENDTYFKYVDYFEEYEHIMQFNKNKNEYIHRWYPFVEGYSKEFIRSIINELPFKPNCCLEPFAGSGTTPVELQKLNLKCISFEVNPFMYELAKTKMRTDYTVRGFKRNFSLILDILHNNQNSNIESIYPPPAYKKITKKEGLKKWNFNKAVLRGILDIKYAISQISDYKYTSLFRIALAAILLDVSNLYRNGKCLSYKKDWENVIKYTRTQIHGIFKEKVETVILPDIVKLNKYKREQGKLLSNFSLCNLGDCRENLDELQNNSIDLVITSPPYLNSRDYTDTYMLELWTLDYIKDYSNLRNLREKTLRSHVQLKWGEVELLEIEELRNVLTELDKYKEEFWNDEIPGMIKGYFQDLNILFEKLSRKMKAKGRVYFNVANSAYYGVEIKTDVIVSIIAENHGFSIKEIRMARKLNPSAQQKDKIPYLLEVVIVMEKKAS